MNPVRFAQKTFHWLVDLCGAAALMALLVVVVLSAWGLLLGWPEPEPGTWGHAALLLGLGTLVLATAVQSRRERKRFERLRREERRRNEIADARSRAMLAEADRLVLRARARDARRRETRDRHM